MILDLWGFLAIIIVVGMVTSMVTDVLKHRSRSASKREMDIIQNKLASLEAQVESLWNKLETGNVLAISDDEEKELILRKLEENHWDKVNAAKSLGMDRVTLYRKMKQHNIS